ncbi:MAG TPA: hypothetical protein PLW51_06205, partial [Bacillota bacterium]|nr:hypothetical protein [Bacillota bacterium]HPZ41871.1 hypothetical protein [Bacillota bacterium]HQD52760.1 hypothetical protein [Bacillota bacterium]
STIKHPESNQLAAGGWWPNPRQSIYLNLHRHFAGYPSPCVKSAATRPHLSSSPLPDKYRPSFF